MGVLLVAGFVTLVVGFIQLATPSNDTRQAVIELSIADQLLGRLGLPASSRVISLAAIDDRLVVLIDMPDGEQRLFTVDPGLVLDTNADSPNADDNE